MEQLERNVIIKNGIAFAVAILGFAAAFLIDADAEGKFGVYGGIILLVPIVYAYLTERMIEGFIIAGMIGAVFFTKGQFLVSYPYKIIETLMDEDTLWVILILCIMACITQLLKSAGGMTAFVALINRRIKSKRGILVLTWLTSLFFFFDDYLNCLLRGGALKKLTDDHRISREMLAYQIDSTAASVCIIVPISTWAVYVSGIFEMVGYAPEGDGISYFIKTIPFNFYAWFVLLISFLVALRIIPAFGPMKKAEEKMQTLSQGEINRCYHEETEADDGGEIEDETVRTPKIRNFLLPIIVITAATIVTEMDVLIGGFIGLIFTFFFFLFQRVIRLSQFGEACLKGITRMLQPIILLGVCFTCAGYFMDTGFSDWLIGIVEKSGITPALIPLLIFIFVAIFEFFAGGEWITYMIMMPVFLPLSEGIGANTNLVAAAIVAAGIFGSNICIIAEATILTSASTGCSVVKHTITQMPYGFMAAALSMAGFAVSGMLLT